MNICKYLEKYKVYGEHYKIKNNLYFQIKPLDLSHKEITCLKNFVQTEELDLDNNKIKSLDGFTQDVSCRVNSGIIIISLCIAGNNLTSLKGFKQETLIYAEHNKIKSLDGFIQTRPLNLSGNPIRYLGNFKQTERLVLDFKNIRDIKYWKGYNGFYTNQYNKDVHYLIPFWKINNKLDSEIKKVKEILKSCIIR